MSKPKIDWSKNPHNNLDNDATWLKCENSTLRRRIAGLEAEVQEWKEERQRCWDAWQQVDAERDKWKRLAIHSGKRLEAVRALVITKHESLSNFVSRVRECLYQDHYPEGKP